jgi:mitogen-activated protein kinase kinase
MLLQHAWLAPLAKPDIIAEEDEEEQEITVVVTDSSDPTPDTSGSSNEITPDDTETVSLVVEENIGSTPLKLQPDVVDREVAEWVLEAIERRKSGKMGHSAAPALHKAPLDVVSTPEAAKAPVQRTESAPPA